MKVLLLLYKFVSFGPVLTFSKTLIDCFDWNFSLIMRRYLVIELKIQLKLHKWQNFFLRIMAILRNKKKLEAVSRETPENTRNSQSQNTLDPRTAQEYISQVSEEIEWRVIKKPFKEISRTVPGILGALSRLDAFLLNPRVRTCFREHPGTTTQKTGNPLGIVP